MSYTPKYLIENKNKYPDEPALSVKIDGIWSTLTWLEYYEFVVKIAKSFLDLNIDVHSARITTLGERVEDNFQLLDSKNGKFLTKNKKNDLTKSLNNL